MQTLTAQEWSDKAVRDGLVRSVSAPEVDVTPEEAEAIFAKIELMVLRYPPLANLTHLKIHRDDGDGADGRVQWERAGITVSINLARLTPDGIIGPTINNSRMKISRVVDHEYDHVLDRLLSAIPGAQQGVHELIDRRIKLVRGSFPDQNPDVKALAAAEISGYSATVRRELVAEALSQYHDDDFGQFAAAIGATVERHLGAAHWERYREHLENVGADFIDGELPNGVPITSVRRWCSDLGADLAELDSGARMYASTVDGQLLRLTESGIIDVLASQRTGTEQRVAGRIFRGEYNFELGSPGIRSYDFDSGWRLIADCGVIDRVVLVHPPGTALDDPLIHPRTALQGEITLVEDCEIALYRGATSGDLDGSPVNKMVAVSDGRIALTGVAVEDPFILNTVACDGLYRRLRDGTLERKSRDGVVDCISSEGVPSRRKESIYPRLRDDIPTHRRIPAPDDCVEVMIVHRIPVSPERIRLECEGDVVELPGKFDARWEALTKGVEIPITPEPVLAGMDMDW